MKRHLSNFRNWNISWPLSMKVQTLSMILFFVGFSITNTSSQVVINEIKPDGSVELKNLGNSAVNVSGYILCDFPAYQSISNSSLDCGVMMLGAGEILTVNDFNTINNADGEMGLYTSAQYTNPDAMIDYVEWGSTGHQRSSIAVMAGIWTTGAFVPAFGAGESLEYDGEGEGVADWGATAASTLCDENSNSGVACDADGGTLEGGPFVFCVDGEADNVSGITLNGNSGMNNQWVITDPDGKILGLPPMPGVVDFDAAGAGVCLIWNLAYDNGLIGLVVDNNVSDLVGCYDLSNEIVVTRNQPEGGLLEGGPFEFCVDGTADFVSGITLSGNTGGNNQWIVTDPDGNILGLPPMPGVVDFDEAGAGVCLIWNIAYEDGLTGLEAGMNVSGLDGCFDISNEIVVTRNQPDGGLLEGGPFVFCVDGVADFVSGITLSGNTGANNQWIVTDPDGNILGLPPMPGVVDFDEAGTGVCLIWNIAYEDGLTGLEAGMNVSGLDGCFDISNEITVYRESPDGGTVELATGGTTYTGAAGDIIFDVTHTTTAINLSYWYIITDNNDNILAWHNSADGPTLDLSGAPAGECHVWGWSYRGLDDPIVGEPITSLTDDACEAISSNWITVIRQDSNCEANGGVLEGGPFEFCVDGIADMVSDITLTGNEGMNNQWVITDLDGTILGLPPMPGVVDFDAAGAGVCLIWNLAYEDGLVGLEAMNNVSDLEGCYDLSNEIVVTRNQPDGGLLEGGPFVFCVDGTPDMVSGITISGNTGANNQWVITDPDGNILGLPPMPGVVDFDAAGAGVCLIWNISYEDGLVGLEAMNNVADLVGCFDISNAVTVYRETPDGGSVSLTDGSTVYVGTAGDIVFDVQHETTAPNLSYWYIITDNNDNILAWHNSVDGPTLDLSGAPAGECHIWGWNYQGLGDPIVGENISTLADDDCEAISSNWITVQRLDAACPTYGGLLEGGPFVFCVDGVADMVSGITNTGNTGTNNQWIVTDPDGNILGLPPMPGVVDFDEAGAGVCLIWNIAYEDGLTGLEAGMNVSDLTGCFDISNAVTVYREIADGGTVQLTNGETTFTGTAGDIVFDVEHTTTASNLSYWYIITDADDNILAWHNSADGPTLDLSGAPAGECHVWGWSYRGLDDPIVGEPITSLTDDACEAISSNWITVIRQEACDAMGGVLEGGPFEFCVDGTPDFVSGITLTGNAGTNNQWIVTDPDGNILGLPPMPGVVDFDEAGAGVCLIWNIAYEDGLVGLEAMSNVADLEGCFNISNAITVTRNQALGGVVEGGPFVFCVDGEADNVSGITISGNDSPNNQWIVTDPDGNILGLPPMPGAVDFDEAGAGVCLIWNVGYYDGLVGLEANANVNDLEGCFAISNSVTVTRYEVAAGTLEGGPYTFCIDDSSDFVTDLVLVDNVGENSQYVVTDVDGNILGLPPTPDVVDFNGAGVGVCLIWHISYEGDISGLEMDANIDDIAGAGCFDISNSITVTRDDSGEACITATREEDLFSSIRVFPNPTTDIINIEYQTINGFANGQAILIDAFGRKITSQGLQNERDLITIDISNVSSGAYYIHLQFGNQSIAKRVIIMK